MNKFFYKFYVALVLFCFLSTLGFSQDEFQIIESRITQYLKEEVNGAKLEQDIKMNAASLKANGSWSTIDYSSTASTGWAPLSHLHRIKQFALALASQDQKSIDQKLANQTITAVRYWLKADPQSTNWFQGEIASPTNIGEILMLLKNTNILPKSLQDSLLTQMSQGNVVKAVGANKLDIAIHMIYRACVTRDKALMDSAVHQAFLPITLTNKQGLQSDYSYLQHGPQLQIASYGQVFLTGEYKVAFWLLGTSYALSDEKVKILDHYLVDTFLKTIRGRYIDFNTEGRAISRNDVLDKFDISGQNNDHALLALAKKVSQQNIEKLEEAQQRISQKQPPSFKIEPSHTHFWKGDYTLHLRPAYSVNVRSVSKRTVRAEQGNNENLLAKFLPDGSTNIQRSGSEYFNIMPVWEWDKIPGITARDYPVDPKMTIEWGERGISPFVGGVSDGIYGASVYQLNYNEVTAKKAWFFFDNEVVCLGADINSFAKEPITTTVNQAWSKGPVKAFANGKLSTINKKLSANNLQWIWHDSIGYYFPNQGNLELSKQTQKGSWYKINTNRSTATVKGDVFKLWFNHGTDPLKQTYAYVVKPGVSEKNMLEKPQSAVQILANNEKLQAVKNESLQMLQVVFYEAGSVNDDKIAVTVDQACVLMIKNINSKNPTIYVADPTQKLTDLKLTFSSTLFKVTEPISITLPQGNQKGATVSIKLD